jgi:hypothetical protein
MADECMGGGNPLGAFAIDDPIGSVPCFYCRRGMHDSCISGRVPCPCCANPDPEEWS